MTSRTKVLGALSGVRDPELDKPITELGFISELEIEDGFVGVRLRLPTYFCAPNFAYLMVADAKEAVLSVPGVRRARVTLDDHHASGEINAGMADERGFEGTFPGETEGENLDELRAVFRRKSFVSRQEKLCRTLLAAGYSATELAETRLGEVPASQAKEKYLSRREELGLDISAGAPLLVDPDGNQIPKDAVEDHLRFARITQVSIEANAEMCRGLLANRYGIPDPEEVST